MAMTLVGSSGVTGGAASGVSVTLTFATAPSAGDIAIVLNVTTATSQSAQTILSGSGAAYTTLVSTANGNLRVRLAYRICGAGETTATCSGSGAAADATAAGAFVFRGATPYTPVVISSRATGTSSRPDSPGILADHSGCAVVSIVAALANSAAAVTAPTGYLNLISTGVSDTRSCQLGMSWFGSTNTVNSPLSYDPTAYSSFTSAAWMGFSVVLQSTDPYTALDFGQQVNSITPMDMYGKLEVVGY